jgi:flagellar motor switch protein FliN
MSDTGSRLTTMDNARLLLDGWAESLAQVFEVMAGEKPEIHWQTVEKPPEKEADLLWWEQPFQVGRGVAVWVGAPAATWEYAGSITLKAAGLDAVEIGESKNTWMEILGQSLSAMARSAGSMVGKEVACGSGSEDPPPNEVSDYASVTLKFAEADPASLAVALSPALIDLISAQAAASEEALPESEEHPSAPAPPAIRNSRTMELLLDIELPVSISFGRIRLPMKDVLKLTTGSIVELDRGVNEPVEVLVNRCLIAKGEVVVVEGNYGVRIQQIASRQDRMRSVR